MTFESNEKYTAFSEDAEQGLLASVLHGGVLPLAVALITPDDFYSEVNGRIFKVMAKMEAQDKFIEASTLVIALEDDGVIDRMEAMSYVIELDVSATSKHSTESHAHTIKNYSNERQVLRVAGEMINTIKRGDGSSVERVNDAMSLFNAIETESHTQKEFKEQMKDFHVEMEKRAQSADEVSGLATGFEELDIATSGMQGGDLIYLAARPGQGKTTFGMNIAGNVAKRLKNDEGVVLVFSMEMSASQLIGRMHATEGHVKMDAIKNPKKYMNNTPGRSYEEFGNGAKKLTQMIGNLIIDDRPGLNPMQVRAAAQAAARKYGKVKLILMDYVQIMTHPDHSNPVESIGACSNSLKSLAMEMDCPVLSLAQLNREIEKRADKRPLLSDLKGSGSLEQDADAVWFIHSDKDEDGEAIPAAGPEEFVSIIIAKFRAGEAQDILFKRDLSTMRFINHSITGRY